MAPVAEARAQDAVGDRLAQQELLQRAAELVEEVDRAVVALVAVDAARLRRRPSAPRRGSPARLLSSSRP